MPTLHAIALAGAAYVVLGVAVAAIAGRRARGAPGSSERSFYLRTGVALGLALGGLATPFLVPAELPLVRAMLTFGTALFVVRGIDLARDPVARPIGSRVLLCFAVLDSRALTGVVPRFEARKLLIAIAYAVVAAIGIALASRAPLGAISRWLGGALFVYGLADASSAFMEVVWRLAGYRIPEQHRAPILATSIRQFWGERWNRNVHAWLLRNAYEPAARARGRRAGVIAAFVASALIHAWLVFVPLGLSPAISMAAYFLLQGALMAIEPFVLRGGAPSIGARVWTVACVLGTAPLFLEPFLDVVLG